jgi:hypothetical protein
MDINLLFGLIAFLGGIWVFLLRHILDLTAASSTDPLLMPLACVHATLVDDS